MCISITGSRYIGTTIAACFAEFADKVVHIDISQEVANVLRHIQVGSSLDFLTVSLAEAVVISWSRLSM